MKLNFVKGVGLVMLPRPAPLERFLCAGQGLPLASVIRHYELRDKDKFVLAHSIASSFWRFYATDFMRHRWTSHDVWFMRERDHHDRPNDQIALQAFVPIDFEVGSRIPEELRDEMSTHPFPHILGLGILLLEIGLSQTHTSDSGYPLVSRLNRDHGHAIRLLGRLEKAEWSRPAHKDLFARAIEGCLDPSKFTTPDERCNPVTGPKVRKEEWEMEGSTKKDSSLSGSLGEVSATDQKNNPRTPTASDATQETLETDAYYRRDMLFREVVEPLAKLAKVAFKVDTSCVSYLERCKEGPPAHDTAMSQLASFHIGKTVVPNEWLDNLKHISKHVSRLRRQKEHVYSPVKIAILDTGYDPQLDFFKASQRARCIKSWKNFVSHDTNGNQANTTAQDTFGHGSLMTRLAMESAPLADIYVGRVAVDTSDLGSRSEEIAEVARLLDLIFPTC